MATFTSDNLIIYCKNYKIIGVRLRKVAEELRIKNSQAAAGDISYMRKNEQFNKNICK